jgi:hypothetical protein
VVVHGGSSKARDEGAVSYSSKSIHFFENQPRINAGRRIVSVESHIATPRAIRPLEPAVRKGRTDVSRLLVSININRMVPSGSRVTVMVKLLLFALYLPAMPAGSGALHSESNMAQKAMVSKHFCTSATAHGASEQSIDKTR